MIMFLLKDVERMQTLATSSNPEFSVSGFMNPSNCLLISVTLGDSA